MLVFSLAMAMMTGPEPSPVEAARGYAGPTEVATPLEPERLPSSDPQPRVPPKPEEPAPPRTDLHNPGARWRLAYVISTHFAYGEDLGFGFGIYVGAGVPSKSKLRARHSFGYAGELTFGVFGGLAQRHRAAASGTVGRKRPDLRRTPSLYYYAAFGAAVWGTVLAGPSLGARIGFASSRSLDYILAIGGDLDVLRFPGSGYVAAIPMLHFSLLTFGSL